MPAQNYAKKYTDIIDEAYRLDSVIDPIKNQGIKLDFSGVNSVTIYNMDPTPEGNYIRTGRDRFGELVEIGTGIQTFTLSQDKASTGVIDEGNLQDSMSVQTAAKWLKMQMAEVFVPNTDIYCLSVVVAYALANGFTTGGATALTASNVWQKVVAAGVVLTNKLVPKKDRYLYASATTVSLIKNDSNFIKATDMAQKILVEGVVGMIDGNIVMEVPDSFLPSNCGFVILHKRIVIVPMKIELYRVLTDVQGIHGAVPETRRYYDTFLPTKRAKGIVAHFNS